MKKVINDITFEKFVEFSDSFFAKTWIESLVVGNITQKAAIDIAKTAENGLKKLRPNNKVL